MHASCTSPGSAIGEKLENLTSIRNLTSPEENFHKTRSLGECVSARDVQAVFNDWVYSRAFFGSLNGLDLEANSEVEPWQCHPI